MKSPVEEVDIKNLTKSNYNYYIYFNVLKYILSNNCGLK